MSRLAKNEIYFGDYVSLDSLVEGIDRVSEYDVLDIAQKVMHPERFTNVTLRPKR
jgi:predicted Zn-dependent peptidase